MTLPRLPPPAPVSVRAYGPRSEPVTGPTSSRASASGMLYARGEPTDAPGFRIHAEAVGGVTLRFPTFGVAGEVAGLNPIALSFRADGDIEIPLHEPLEGMIEWEGARIGPLRGRIEPNPQHRGEHLFKIAMRDMSFEMAAQLMGLLRVLLERGAAELPRQPPRVEEPIRDPERARRIVNALSILTGQGSVRGPGIQAPVRLEGLSEEGSVVWLHDESLQTWGSGPWAVEVVGYNSLYTMFFESVKTQGGVTITPIPRLVIRTRYRYFRRVPVRSPRNIRFLHPRWNDAGVSQGVIKDVSYGGLGFEFDPEESILFPGLRIPMFTLDGDDGEPIRLTGILRSVRPSPGAGKMICGVATSPWCAEDEPHWIKLVATQLHPRTDTSEKSLEELWDLFDSSGYFNLAGRDAGSFAALKRRFFSVGKRAVDAPHLLCQTIWPSPKGVEASISFLKAYETAWMGHQLAKRHGKGATPGLETVQVLRDVYCHSFEHPQTDPDLRWIVGLVEPEVRWVQGSHLDFVRRQLDTREVLGVPVHMMSVKCDEASDIHLAEVAIEPANLVDKQLVARRIIATRPECYVDAYDYVPERIDLERLSGAWRAIGMERERAIFVARSKNRAVAALVVESGEEGTNLFRLLDCSRVFPIAKQVQPEVYALLIDEARRWFAARGRTEFLFFREDPDDSYVTMARLHLISVPYLWIISARLIPDFVEHVGEVAGGSRKVSVSRI